VNTYWPNSGDKLAKLQKRQDFNKAFQGFIATLKHKHVVVAGDLNVAPHPVDLHNPKGNKLSAGFSEEERADFHELCRESQLLDTWREMNPVDVNKSLGIDGVYTYWGFKHNARENNRGWRVDHILITSGLRPHLEKAFIRRELLGSDHTAVGILLDKSVLEAKKD
jgi:exodeoxyribonuclease III